MNKFDFPPEVLTKISNTPALLSLLYDADLLPEQIETARGAKSMMAVVIAYDLQPDNKEASGGD